MTIEIVDGSPQPLGSDDEAEPGVQYRLGKQFGSSRESQYKDLDSAFGISRDAPPLPVVVIWGSRGSGKSSILREALIHQHSLMVDCAAASSAMAVLSTILRRLSLPLKMREAADLSDTEPEATDDQYLHRQAFKDAKKKLGPENGQVPKHSKISRKFEQICSWAEVRSLTGFRHKFESAIFWGNFKKIIIVLENAHVLAEPRNFQVLDFLTTLHKTLPAHAPAVSFVLVSSRQLPEDITQKASAVIEFLGYNDMDASLILYRALLEDSHGFPVSSVLSQFIETFVALKSKAYRGDFTKLLAEAKWSYSHLREKLEKIEAAPPKPDVSKKDALKLTVKNFLGAAHSARPEAKLRMKSEIKKLVISGFLAAHDPRALDRQIFSTRRSSASRRATNSFKKAKENADAITIRAPLPFELQRLIAIQEYNSGGKFNGSIRDLQTIRSLTQQGLFKRCSGDWLDGSVRLACHAPLSLVQKFAEDTNILLDEVLV